MRWQVEAAVKQGLSRVPQGPVLYRWLQRRSGRLAAIDVAHYWPERGRVLTLAEAKGVAPLGARILEIGTGWHPVLALVAALRGAGSVVTVDVNAWMDHETLQAAASAALDIVQGERCDATREELVRRVAGGVHRGRSVRDVLTTLGIAYVAPGDATSTGLGDGSVDLVMHTDVLEHVPPATIARLLTESRRVLRRGGVHVARVCPGDHFAERDPRITTAHHLRFSERSWRWIGGSGLAYHNRLRASDFVRAFEEAGFTVAVLQRRVDERARAALAAGIERPNDHFARYDPVDLATTSFHLVARA